MRCIRKVKHLHFSGNGISDGHRQLGLAVPEGVTVQKRLERHYGRSIVRHLYTDGIHKGHHTYPVGTQCHGYLLVEIYDRLYPYAL